MKKQVKNRFVYDEKDAKSLESFKNEEEYRAWKKKQDEIDAQRFK